MSTASTTSSGKRKRSPAKFYAVKVGRIPGIYYSWDDCKQQTDGVTAVYKSFATLTEAEAFLRGASTTPSNSTAKAGKAGKFYAVAVGLVPGIYTDWPTVQSQIRAPGAKHKSFATRHEAQTWFDENKRDRSVPISLRGDVSETSSAAASKVRQSIELPAKKQKKDNGSALPVLTNGKVTYEPGYGPLPTDSEDGFDRTLKLDLDSGAIRFKTEGESSRTKKRPAGEFTGPIRVYTDGSAFGNGKVGAVGGVGVYFGPNDPRNVSEALRGKKQTNQRAELVAIARALDHVPIDRDVIIVTDSRYSIQCLTTWFHAWERNNWKSSTGKDVENKDLIEPIIARIREREMTRAKTKLEWVKGHANDPGNVAADRLAVNGSRSSTPFLRNSEEFSVTLRGPMAAQENMAEEKEEEAASVRYFRTQLSREVPEKSDTTRNGDNGGAPQGINDPSDFVDSPAGFLYQSLNR